MEVGDVVELTWLDSGLALHNATEEEAIAASLCEVTVYGKVVACDSKRVVLAQEVNRGDVGTYGVVLRGCVVRVTVLRPAKVRRPAKHPGEGSTTNAPAPVARAMPEERRATVSGWGLSSSTWRARDSGHCL